MFRSLSLYTVIISGSSVGRDGGETKQCTLDGLSSDRGAATGHVLMSYLIHIPASFLSRQRILTLGIQHV